MPKTHEKCLTRSRAGDTFFATLPNGTTVNHLCIVLTDEDGFLPSVFVVPVMTPTERFGGTTLLEPRDHPFLKYTSYVSFVHLVEQDKDTIAAKIVRPSVPISLDCLKRVIDGALTSPDTPKGVKRDLRERLKEADLL